MMRRGDPYSSQIAIAQRASASGTARIRPRAKLRGPAVPATPSLKSPKGSFISALPLIGTNSVLLSARDDCNNASPAKPFPGRSLRRLSTDEGTAISVGAARSAMADALLFARLMPCAEGKGSRAHDGSLRQRPIRIKPGPGQRRRRQWLYKGLLTLAAVGLSRPAAADETKVLTPIQIFDPEQGQGWRLGPDVVALPQLDADVTYNSNVYNVRVNTIDDFIFSFRPEVTLRTALPRHELSVRAAGDFERYAQTGSENSDQYEFDASGRLDLANRTELAMDGGYRRGIEQRGTAGDLFLTDRPVEYDQAFGAISLQRTGGFLEMLGEARISRFDYKNASINGVPIDLSDRDVTIRRARLRASAPTGRNTRVFLEVSGNQVRYENIGIVPRNSNGFALLGGFQRNVTDLISVEGAIGYIEQDFKDPAVKTVKGLNYHFLLNWTPRPNWQVTASADRVIDRSPREDVPAILRSTFRLEAKNAVSDRLLLTADAGMEVEQYRGIAREDRRFFVDARVHYRLTNQVGLIGQVGYRTQNGKGGGRDYHGVSATVGVRLAV